MTNNIKSNGLGFCSLLTIVFITLKLMGYVSWSWWWIFSPLWIPSGLVAIVISITGLICFIIYLTRGRFKGTSGATVCLIMSLLNLPYALQEGGNLTVVSVVFCGTAALWLLFLGFINGDS